MLVAERKARPIISFTCCLLTILRLAGSPYTMQHLLRKMQHPYNLTDLQRALTVSASKLLKQRQFAATLNGAGKILLCMQQAMAARLYLWVN